MNRREIFLSAGLVFLIALVVRIVAASLVVFPQPEDTAYYVGVARNLLEGHGLTSDALWSYGTPPLSFPRPAFEVWLPLPTFLAAIPMAQFGATFPSAQLSSVVVGAIVPVLAWRLGADAATERRLSLSRTRVLALGAGLTSAVYLPLVLHSALPDSTMPFAALALAACLLMPRILRDAGRVRLTNPKVIALGVLIGLAALTRNEAAFLGLAWLVAVWRHAGPRAQPQARPHRDAGRRRPRDLRSRGWSGTGSCSGTRCRARPCPTPCRSPASTSSPGTTRRRSRAISPRAPSASC